jgi:hypothetical protein
LFLARNAPCANAPPPRQARNHFAGIILRFKFISFK